VAEIAISKGNSWAGRPFFIGVPLEQPNGAQTGGYRARRNRAWVRAGARFWAYLVRLIPPAKTVPAGGRRGKSPQLDQLHCRSECRSLPGASGHGVRPGRSRRCGQFGQAAAIARAAPGRLVGVCPGPSEWAGRGRRGGPATAERLTADGAYSRRHRAGQRSKIGGGNKLAGVAGRAARACSSQSHPTRSVRRRCELSPSSWRRASEASK